MAQSANWFGRSISQTAIRFMGRGDSVAQCLPGAVGMARSVRRANCPKVSGCRVTLILGYR